MVAQHTIRDVDARFARGDHWRTTWWLICGYVSIKVISPKALPSTLPLNQIPRLLFLHIVRLSCTRMRLLRAVVIVNICLDLLACISTPIDYPRCPPRLCGSTKSTTTSSWFNLQGHRSCGKSPERSTTPKPACARTARSEAVLGRNSCSAKGAGLVGIA